MLLAIVVLVVALDTAFLEVERHAELNLCRPVVANKTAGWDSFWVGLSIQLVAERTGHDAAQLGVPAFGHLPFESCTDGDAPGEL